LSDAVVADLEDLGVTVISATEGHDPLGRGIQLVVAEANGGRRPKGAVSRYHMAEAIQYRRLDRKL